MLLRACRSVALAALVAACGHPPDEIVSSTCTPTVAGNAQAAPIVQVLILGPDGETHVVSDGDRVPLVLPPQGGRVILAGVRATNLSPCAVNLSGSIRDESSQQIRLDARTVNLVPAGGGWVESHSTDWSTFANIPVCPNQWANGDLFGVAYSLTVSVTDVDSRKGSATISVVPACSDAATATQCTCICQADYVLGQACPVQR